VIYVASVAAVGLQFFVRILSQSAIFGINSSSAESSCGALPRYHIGKSSALDRTIVTERTSRATRCASW
jgi:hypothetical protein